MTRRIPAFAAAAALAWAVQAGACDDHVGTCEIEAWRWYAPIPGMLAIEGSVSCDSGMASIRLFEQAGGEQKFLGTATGIIDGHVLEAIATNIDEPDELVIRYSIDPR